MADDSTEDHKKITEECLGACEQASAFLESLSNQYPFRAYAPPNTFKVQLQMHQALKESRDTILKAMDNIRKGQAAPVKNDDTGNASSMGEFIADGNSDQVIVVTEPGHFDVGRAVSKTGSAQLVGSMRAEQLQQFTEQHYG